MPKKISDLKKALEQEKDIHTDFRESMTYGEYLSLDQILSSQKRLSGHHDEMLFIIIHQVSELWMKLILHELRSSIEDIGKDDMQPAFKKLARVSKIQSQIIQAWDVLSTMTPAEYLEFRDSLGRASGFQSYQYRLIEFALGYKSEAILKIYEKDVQVHHELKEAYVEPGLYDAAIGALSRAGFPINKDLLNRDYSVVYAGDPTVAAAWEEVYRDVGRYWD